MNIYSHQYKPASSIAKYLCFGSKTSDIQSLGFELEHFVVTKGSRDPVPFCVDKDSSQPSVEGILERIKPFYSEYIYEDDEGGPPHLFGMTRDRIAITLEPGAQLEVSIGPAHSIGEIKEIYDLFRKDIDPVLESMGVELLELGYHPTAQARNIPLLPKSRYRFMNEHFLHTGKHGMSMMRATASTQVSVDYKNEQDALTKFRIANALGPLLAFITDNSPVFESEQVGALGGSVTTASSGLLVPHRMARMVCWDDTDPARSLITTGGFDDDFGFARYAEVLVNAPAIFMPAKNADSLPEFVGFTPFKELLEDEFIDEDLVLHILSLFFFDARFKSYLELRQADSLPIEYALAFTALVSGIFYNSEAIEHYSRMFKEVSASLVAAAKTALREHGYEAEVYGRKASEWLDEMIRLAQAGLSDSDLPYLEPLAQLVKQNTTLLDGVA